MSAAGRKTNRSGTASAVGKNQGSKEGVVRCFEISRATALRIADWKLIRATKLALLDSLCSDA